MAENLGGSNPFSSGGHRWEWGDRPYTRSGSQAIGLTGAVSQLLSIGATPGRVIGILRTTGATRATADADLTVLEQAIIAKAVSGDVYAWEDDAGRTGSSALVLAYRRIGARRYSKTGSTFGAWQDYEAALAELGGEPD